MTQTFHRGTATRRVMSPELAQGGDLEVHLDCPDSPTTAPALCGYQPPSGRQVPVHGVKATCAVCLDLSAGPCPRCGRERHSSSDRWAA